MTFLAFPFFSLPNQFSRQWRERGFDDHFFVKNYARNLGIESKLSFDRETLKILENFER